MIPSNADAAITLRGVSSIGTGTSVNPFSFVNSTSKDDSASRIGWKPSCLAQYSTLFLSAQPSRGWLGFRQSATMLCIGGFLLHCRRRRPVGGAPARRGLPQYGPAHVAPGGDQTAQTLSPLHARGGGSRPRGLPAPTAPATSCTSGAPPPRRPSGPGKGRWVGRLSRGSPRGGELGSWSWLSHTGISRASSVWSS